MAQHNSRAIGTVVIITSTVADFKANVAWSNPVLRVGLTVMRPDGLVHL